MTRKGYDQTEHMRTLVLAFAGRTYHIVGNLMPWLEFIYVENKKSMNSQCNCGYGSILLLELFDLNINHFKFIRFQILNLSIFILMDT